MNDAHSEGERLQKVLARLGVGSRRVCEGYIEQGMVAVNGTPAVLGQRVQPADEVTYRGAVLSTQPDRITYLFNKPSGVITTASDPQGRPTVVEAVPETPRVFPVGRLDFDSEGLLLLTNDGAMTHRLTHPSFGIEKEYVVHVEGRPARSALRRLREGIELDDGRTAPAKVAAIAPGLVKIVVHEGRNRQVRRMCEAVGHSVRRLIRTRIGPITDPKLKPGSWRPLTSGEVFELQQAVKLPPPVD